MTTMTTTNCYYPKEYYTGYTEAMQAVQQVMNAVTVGDIRRAQGMLEDLRKIEQQMQGILACLDESAELFEQIEDL